MRKLIVFAGAAMLAATAATVNAKEGLYLGPSISAYFLDSKRVISGSDNALVGGLNLGYRFFNDWALEAGVARDFAGDDLDVAKIDFLYWFGEDREGWRPYFVGGLAYYERDTDNAWEDERYSHQLGLGFGLSNMIEDNWEIRGDVRLMQKIRNMNGSTDGAINLALNYYFNPPAPAAQAKAEPTPAPEPETAPEPEKRTITVRLNVEFEFDSANVRAIYGDEFRAVASAMRAHDDIDLVLEGHTDSRGPEDYNQRLSERRASAVKDRLVEQYGIDRERISTVGYGESRPIADNRTEEGRARNRRVIGEMTYTEVAPR